MQELTEVAGYLDSHTKSVYNVGASNFGYRSRISDRPISEEENSKDGPTLSWKSSAAVFP